MRKRAIERAAVRFGLALALALCCVPAAAQDPDAAVARGAELYEAGRHAEAAAAWEEALQQLGPEAGWKLHYNLGLAYQAAGDAGRAVERFESFVKRVAAEPTTLAPEVEQRREDAAARLAAIKNTHGAVELPPQASQVAVRIDGGAPRPTGFTAYLAPGRHRIEIASEAGSRSEDVEVSAGGRVRIDTSPPAPAPNPPVLPPPVPPPAPEPARQDDAEFPTAIVLVGAGLTVASFALPIALWRVAESARSDAEALGTGHTGYPAAVEDFEAARTAHFASYALPAGLGAITLGVAIWGWVHVANDDDDGAVEGGLAPLPGGGVVQLRGRF